MLSVPLTDPGFVCVPCTCRCIPCSYLGSTPSDRMGLLGTLLTAPRTGSGDSLGGPHIVTHLTQLGEDDPDNALRDSTCSLAIICNVIFMQNTVCLSVHPVAED